MDVEQLERRIDVWKHWLLVAIGASVMFFITTLVNRPRTDAYSGWYFVFVALWLAMMPPGFVLWMGKKWRTVPLAKRLNIAFGFLGCGWLALLSLGIVGILMGDMFCLSSVLLATLILGSVYIYLRGKINASEEMFP